MKKNSIKDLAFKYERVKSRLRRHSSLQITDNREVIIDGCVKVVNCDESVIIIDTVSTRLTIGGAGLKLRNWGSDGVIVSGIIKSIELGEKQHGV
ncbi:MAG: YabP/YqfC family sporulation protein [Oscillospiraceae bacterium]|nr:YabP/YqfC family sporulation protein [Oscillospiraceae bacterium]